MLSLSHFLILGAALFALLIVLLHPKVEERIARLLIRKNHRP